MRALSLTRVRHLLSRAEQIRILTVGDLMLDQFIWGIVGRISPEAPVPVVEFERESFMPGGAANVARNLSSLGASPDLLGVVGRDDWGRRLKKLLRQEQVSCDGVISHATRPTSIKTRIIAQRQQVVRVDREANEDLDRASTQRLLGLVEAKLPACSAVIVGDYGKGVVTQSLLEQLKRWCRTKAIWLSLDPKPVHHLNLNGVSLLTPNRKEAFELAGMPDGSRKAGMPLDDPNLLRVSEILLSKLQPALLLITLGDQGMLLCCRDQKPVHIPTVAQEVFDVSGAGDTVIASFTVAIASGASPLEAAVFSNHAAGVVVGKVGTATVAPDELLASFGRRS